VRIAVSMARPLLCALHQYVATTAVVTSEPKNLMPEEPNNTHTNVQAAQSARQEGEQGKRSPAAVEGEQTRADRLEDDLDFFEEDDDFDEFELHNWEPDLAAVEEDELEWQDDWEMVDQDEDFAAKLAAELAQNGFTRSDQPAAMDA
jgi:hypothetical protein